jgi:threonyl-tRNA synthetase
MLKVPYMLIVGEKEMNEEKVSVRRQGIGDVGQKLVEDFVAEASDEIIQRKTL